MLRLLKLILSTTFFSFAVSSNVEINQTNVPWTEAFVRCNITGSRIASQADIDQDKQLCRKEILQSTSFWIGNYYRLSNIIEVEGCFFSSLLDSTGTDKDRHTSLLDCYKLCTTRSKARIFTHQNTMAGVANCICNIMGVNISELGESKLSSKCFNPDITRALWWKYKLHKSEFQTGNGTCQHISCKNVNPADKFVTDTLCGPRDNDTISDGDLLHVCTTNSNNNTTTDVGLPWKFSFIYNASIETDSDQNKSNVAECKAIACVNGKTYETLTRNCTSETLFFMCLSVESKNDSITSLTTNSSPQPSLNVSSVVQQPVNKDFHNTTRSILARTKSSILPAVFKGKVQPEATRLHISSTTTNNFQNPSSHVPHIMNILENTTTGLSDPLVICHSQIGFIIAGVLGAAMVIIVTVFLLVICWLRQKGPYKRKRIYEDIQVNELDISNYQEIDVDSDQIRRLAVRRVESPRH